VITVNATAKPITYQCLNNANASYIGMNACDTSSSNYFVSGGMAMLVPTGWV
jgi:hypothetical protein